MSSPAIPSPRSGSELLDEYFLENRWRLLDIAAFLDRLDRAGDGAEKSDYRARAFREALAVLSDGEGSRAERIQMVLSDPTTEPLEKLPGSKGAVGAYDRWKGGE